MGKYYFSEEQLEELGKSKYVKKVSEASVQFTDEFKQEYLKLINTSHSSKEALRMLNIKPETLGRERIRSLSERMRKFSIRPEGLNRKENTSKGKKRKLTFNNEQEELAYYKEYALRLEQELEFTKKIDALERRYAAKHSKAKNMK